MNTSCWGGLENAAPSARCRHSFVARAIHLPRLGAALSWQVALLRYDGRKNFLEDLELPLLVSSPVFGHPSPFTFGVWRRKLVHRPNKKFRVSLIIAVKVQTSACDFTVTHSQCLCRTVSHTFAPWIVLRLSGMSALEIDNPFILCKREPCEWTRKTAWEKPTLSGSASDCAYTTRLVIFCRL